MRAGGARLSLCRPSYQQQCKLGPPAYFSH
ncbi:unnamed protein product [Linum tenue]|uniref:Uncharacterized protein n=1 Tax=Linum tenue TaxID=586396 RepID=A0AAV0KFF6_9ROSI|nr:unnamed protein product [Linum tenue]